MAGVPGDGGLPSLRLDRQRARREGAGTVLSGDLTLAEAQEVAPAEIEKRQAQIAALKKEAASLDVAGTTRTGGYRTPAGGAAMGGDMAMATEAYRVPVDLDWRARRKQEIPTEITTLEAEIRKIENEYSNIQAGTGSANVAPAAL